MGLNVTRRSLLSGFAAALGAIAVDAPAAPAHAVGQTGQDSPSGIEPVVNFAVPFAPSGQMGDSKDGQTYLEHLLTTAIVPPLSEVAIYAHGWLTDADNLMVIYDALTQGYGAEMRTLRRAVPARAAAEPAAPGVTPLALPTSSLVIMTHWPSRQGEGLAAPIGLGDLLTFPTMERRANLVGSVGMARLIGFVLERLLADPGLASTRLHLIGHSFGCRVFASALHAFPVQAPEVFAALQTRNRIDLTLLQPAMPADALEPNDLTQAHPFAQLANYRNLRILTTMSRWDIPLRRFYPPHEAQQPNDAVYARAPGGSRNGVQALGGAGPTDATWKAFNGNLPRSEIQVGPGFQAADVITRPGQRLAVADLTPLHAAHHREDMERPAGQLPPFGRPDTRSMGYSGYHTDIYCKEIYHLDIGFTWAHYRV